MGKKLKILLIQPSTLFSDVFDYKNTAVTHLLQMATCLKESQIIRETNPYIQVINLLDEINKKPLSLEEYPDYIKNLLQFLMKFNDGSDLIFGISAFSPNYYISSIVLALSIRKLYPHAIICVGGSQVNFFTEYFVFPRAIYNRVFNIKLFDAIFLGEADWKFVEYISNLIKTAKTQSNPTEPSAIIRSGSVDDLKNLPFIDYSLMDYKDAKKYIIPVFFSRGCPFNCNFCSDYRNIFPEFKEGNKKIWRLTSPELAIKQTQLINQYFHENTDMKIEIHIFDPLFAYPEWRIKYYQGLIDSDITTLIWAEYRIDQFSINKEIEFLKKTNIKTTFGLESGSYEMLKIMNKTKNPKRYLEDFQKIANELYNIQTYAAPNVILGHPGETKQTLQETFAYLDKIMESKNNIIPYFMKFMLTFGSQVSQNIEYYKKKFGSKFYLPYYWLIPKCSYQTGVWVDASYELPYMEVYKFSRDWMVQMYKNIIRNLQPLRGDNEVYELKKNRLMLGELQWWKNEEYLAIENMGTKEELESLTKDFWNRIIDENLK